MHIMLFMEWGGDERIGQVLKIFQNLTSAYKKNSKCKNIGRKFIELFLTILEYFKVKMK